MVRVQGVPFLDLKSQTALIRSELDAALASAIDASDFVLGPRVEAFESAFASYCESVHAIGVNSGTDALYLILRALGIGPGDEVITVPNMFIAAVEAVALTGARPVLVDVDPDTYCIDPEAVERAVTPRTRAVIPVHLFGLPADMAPLMDMARRHGFHVIEDACQAHGATHDGRRAGALGHAAAFSFYPTKNLGGFGDGGAVTTNDGDLAARVRALRHHAQPEKNVHTDVGHNSRLDGLQAVVLHVKLAHLDAWNERRRAIARRYRERLEGTDYRFQEVPNNRTSVFHLVAVQHPKRQEVHDRLDRANVGWGRHIAQPIHQQPGYAYLGYRRGSFPVSEQLCDELVSLPVFPTLDDAQVDYVCDALSKVGISV